MDFVRLREVLADELCGLYFLAGLDFRKAANEEDVLAIHAAEGAFGLENQHHIKSAVAAVYPELKVSVQFHSRRDLHLPDTLEKFAGLFEHDHIIADPTGAFVRAPKLLTLARSIRTEFGNSIEQILWRAEFSALVVVTAPLAAEISPSGNPVVPEKLRNEISALVERLACSDLRQAVKSIDVAAEAPAGRCVPVDNASFAVPNIKPKPAGLLARFSRIAALVGIGMITSAGAAQASSAKDNHGSSSGFAALSGLTTLGENSVGIRNHYQAVGGLRLYFGDAGILLVPALATGDFGGTAQQPSGNSDESQPVRVAYAT